MKRINALTIAGTDPSGGAGIQADLKTFSALAAYGTSVVTALVAQNTCGVQAQYPVSPDFVAAQLSSVLSDVRIDSMKIGMLSESAIVGVVADCLQAAAVPWVVLDTVMLAKSGDPLLSPPAVATLRQRLLPVVSLVTPNLPEAAVLLDCDIARDETEMRQQGRALLALGCQAVLMKGGHLCGDESPDWLFTAKEEHRFTSPRVPTKNTHGTGCTLSAALAALRPRCDSWYVTVQQTRQWLQGALEQADSLEVGRGHGPVHHFYRWW
ncbi:bifunctional hydroxymethylpyrimidine kinase/phosphomethylpyrimidine kinase [Erwinia mallotivora]|uniref:hydroxymethylpyrimidine kinase n=1 Tax=Erwinia mallotivora TaxID=69222 RepID=A0A014N7B0_9GAMM|nr:bifunctional hydroxymethylpyrimidine kinase/phosphomethylpyrimidine kinase [Erwinia mallotivora]EXU75258.1 hydroxymethylpyrimidine kinase [Erwinia mallotivora]